MRYQAQCSMWQLVTCCASASAAAPAAAVYCPHSNPSRTVFLLNTNMLDAARHETRCFATGMQYAVAVCCAQLTASAAHQSRPLPQSCEWFLQAWLPITLLHEKPWNARCPRLVGHTLRNHAAGTCLPYVRGLISSNGSSETSNQLWYPERILPGVTTGGRSSGHKMRSLRCLCDTCYV